MKNFLGYSIDPRKTNPERINPDNYQPHFILINFFLFIVSFFLKRTYLSESYYSQYPVYFYIVFTIYSTMLQYYCKACKSPGYAKDEENASQTEDGKSNNNNNSNEFFCKRCQIYVPIRASHCLTCNKCILRRDHHCPWTNNCIGRDNHLYFFLFTFLTFISYLIPCIDSIIHLIIYFFYSSNFKDFFQIFISYSLIISGTSFGSLLAFNLFFHCVLTIVRNTTTWERFRRSNITYLKDLPYGYSPFDKGLLGNFVEFCTMRKNKMKWAIDPPDISLFSNELQMLNDYHGQLPEI